MFDAQIRPIIDPALNAQGRFLARLGFTANQVTLIGLALGLVAAGLIVAGATYWALVPLLLSRLADGLDGAVARARGGTDFGGYLDITCDFLFYGAIPFAFILADPASNGVAGAFLLLSFYFNGTSFLGFSLLADRHGLKTDARGQKALYFSGGLLEGAETIGFLVLLCLVPDAFAALAWIFGSLCFLTATSRIVLAARSFGNRSGN
ncbi:CDP-alcohol phosphatidyltransferase family protein [Ruegeria arenilitoris]|uniref:CDP-alcohol phosphatidyltransferase family protein n=1 Tax=Ruegeria arenilitoris TaxID=1173585 RepID=UPI00147D954E|nr:CDP-alcohol phosphatidyltransferase family protein [Ruegeria arenilitoris]MBY6082037.1 CDP-alcohol phosphatidyltransferase family protein [Ruegeria arenilitoris]